MIREAVSSVLAQTHRAIEVIIVDDGSGDSTPVELERIQSAHPELIRVVRQPNMGPGAARNKGLSLASGECIQYLDSDDLLEPTKLEKQVAALQQHPEAGVCYCITLRRDVTTGDMKPWARTAEKFEDLFPSFLPNRGWATLTPLWLRSVCEQIGPWGDFRVMEDWDHDLRAGMLGIKPVHVAEPLCTVRDHADQRASGMNTGFTRELTHDFFRAHESVWTHMKAHELTDWSYVQQFSRTMFWVSRMCGSHDLTADASAALKYVDEMTEINHQPATTRMFRLATGMLGWRVASRVSERVRNLTVAACLWRSPQTN